MYILLSLTVFHDIVIRYLIFLNFQDMKFMSVNNILVLIYHTYIHVNYLKQTIYCNIFNIRVQKLLLVTRHFSYNYLPYVSLNFPSKLISIKTIIKYKQMECQVNILPLKFRLYVL